MGKAFPIGAAAACCLAFGVSSAAAKEFKVDDDGAQCNTPFTSVQAAVDAAAPGDKVKVCPGTYNEQVTITKNKLKVESEKPLQAIIKAPPSMTEPGDIVRITGGAKDVELRGFTISGPLPDSLFCSTTSRTGVRVDGNASAKIEKNHITEIRSTTAALRGCQNGVGILVGRKFETQVGTADIRDNEIDLYQKGAIVVDNAGSYAKVEHNTIHNPGATEITAPNGIQISRGATADVNHNDVTGNVFAGDDPDNDVASGTGILLFQAGVVDIEHNEVYANDDGISLLDTDNSEIDHNRSHDNIVFDGLYADSNSTGNVFKDNKAFGNAEHDCHDDSNGSGTAGTANTWKGNEGETQNRPGLCKGAATI